MRVLCIILTGLLLTLSAGVARAVEAVPVGPTVPVVTLTSYAELL